MMKKMIQVGVATMTAICMVLGLSAAMTKSVPVQAAGEQTNWTFSSVAVEDGTHGYNAPDVTTITETVALGNSKFSGYVKFSSAVGSAMLSQNFSMPSLCFGVNTTNDIWQTGFVKFALVTANGDTYLSGGVNASNQWIFRDQAIHAGEEIFLQVAFNYIDKDNDTVADDLQMKVWVNGTQQTQVQQGYGNWDMLASSDDVCVLNYVQNTNPVTAYVMVHGGQNGAGTITGNATVRSVHDVTVTSIENGKTYCSAVTATVATSATDGALVKDLDKVTVNGSPVSLTEGSFTIAAGSGDTTVVVTDKKGATQTYNVTVNDGHAWGTEYVSNNDATCKEDGTKSLQCTACDLVDTNKVVDAGSKLDHVFETYVSNEDATCVADGHETAECKFGCGEKDTRVAQGSATGEHTYGTDDKCTVCGTDKPNANPNGGATTGGATTGGAATGGSGVATGDYSSVGVMLLLMVVAVATAAVIFRKRIMEQ